MTEYKKVGSKTIAGKKAPVSVYKKNGSNKLYVKRNGLMISYVSYKKSFAKKLLGKTLNKVKNCFCCYYVRCATLIFRLGGNALAYFTG